MIKFMVTRESQITIQIVLNNQPNSNTIENKKPEKFTKLELPYAAYISLFQWLLNNPNGLIEAPRSMNLLKKFQLNPTVDETIWKVSSSIETLRMLLQCEMNFSLLKQLLQDPNGLIEFTQSMNLMTKFQPDSMVNKALVVAGSCWVKFSIFSLFSFFFYLSILLTAVSLFEKTLKINIWLDLHIGSESNPTHTCNLNFTCPNTHRLRFKRKCFTWTRPMCTKRTPRSITTPGLPPRPYVRRVTLNIQKWLIHTFEAQSHGPPTWPKSRADLYGRCWRLTLKCWALSALV